MDQKQFMTLWNKGKNLEGYFEPCDSRMKELREKILTYATGESVVKAVTGLQDDVQVLAFSEPWCPDCVINLTVLEMMAEHSPRMSVRVLGREGHEGVISAHNIERKAYIPTFLVFVNNRMTGVFVERPELLKQRLLDGTQADRIVGMQEYKAGKYADATAEELLEYIQNKG